MIKNLNPFGFKIPRLGKTFYLSNLWTLFALITMFFLGIVSYKSRYKIYIIIVGITASNNDIDIYEIQPGKSLTDDLGIN